MKKQFKKSLSLFLAVLMMLSCWVWVAPEKAEAAAKTSYEVVVTTGTGDGIPNLCEDTHRIVFTFADGTTSEKNWSNAGNGIAGDESFSVNKWPKSIYFQIGSNNVAKARITKITINGLIVFDGGYNLSATGGLVWQSKDDWTITAGDGQKGQTSLWKPPAFNKHGGVEAGEATITKLPSGGSVSTTVKAIDHEDQYGVAWSGSVPTSGFSYKLRYTDTEGVQHDLPSTYGTISGSGSTATATFYDDIQLLFPNRTTANVQAVCYYNNKDERSTNILLYFPTYDSTFYANGGKIGDDDTTAKDSIVYNEDNAKVYGALIGKAPAYATKPGFEFKGFYNVQNADAPGLKTSFNGDKFENNVTKIPVTGDTEWWAAWQAAPITATFVTQDGQLIGTVEGRHNNYLTNTNMYNGLDGLNAAVKGSHKAGKVKFDGNNAPVYTDGSTTYTFDGWRIIEAYDNSLLDKEITGDANDSKVILKGDVTFQAIYRKADAATYTVAFEDGNGNVLTTKDDYKYRDDVINVPADDPTKATDNRYAYEFIGWAKDIGNNFYTVDANDNDENGAKIIYTHKDVAEFVVKGNATYVPVFRMLPREYSVTYNYTVDGGGTDSVVLEGFNWHDVPAMPEIKDNYTEGGFRYHLVGWKVNNAGATKELNKITVEGDMNLTAVYGNREPAKYTINFYGKDADGVTDILVNGDKNIYEHNEEVVIPDVPQIIETEEARYVFQGWSPDISTIAGGDAEYKAVYERKEYVDLHFYNYDGTLIYELDGNDSGLFIGEKIPAYSNIVENEDGTTENALPTKPEDPVGTYRFIGWKDASGNTVEPGVDLFTGETFLTAQFETVFTEYTVKFENDLFDANGEKVIVSEETYHYGDEITVPADPTKPSDVEYIYDFRAWTPEISDICYGHATYTATYRRTPQYYKVTWLDDNYEIFTESNYAYNAKIQQTIFNDVPSTYPAADAGQKWVVDYWVQCNADGEPVDAEGNVINILPPSDLLTNEAYGYADKLAEIDADKTLSAEEKAAKKAIITHMAPIEFKSDFIVKFVRGQKMVADHIYFYPVFKQETNVLTVSFFTEDGTTPIGYANIPYGENIDDYDDAFAAKAPKESDKDFHYIIKDWVENTENGELVTTITRDIAVKATYTAEAHNKKLYEVVYEPTCNVPGYGHYKCDADECTAVDYNVMIPVVDDMGAPDGQFYVGNNKWTLADFRDGIDYDDVKFVGPNTYVVVNAEDTNLWSMPWNLDGELKRGVGKIEYFVSDSVVDNIAEKTDATWTAVYDYEANRQQALNVVLAEKKVTLTEYIGYNHGTAEDRMKKAEIDRAVDALLSAYKANATGSLSNLGLADGQRYVIYIKISEREGGGNVNVSYLSSGTIQYGTEAPEIAISGVGYGSEYCEEATITVTDDTDDYNVYLDGEEVEVTNGKFTCSTKGIHEVTVIDKNGNKTTKTFEIAGGHTNKIYIIAATCTTDGSKYAVCTVCGEKSETTEIIPAIGHFYGKNFVDKAPSCDVDGSRTYICDNNCGTKLVLEFVNGYIDAAKLAQVKKWDEATGDWTADLTTADLKHLMSDGEHTYAKVKDENGEDTFEDVWVIDKAATCKIEGSKHKDCTKCGIKGRVTETIPVDAENGHKYYRAKVTLEPTCTTEGKKTRTCRNCGYEEVTKIIEALGHDEGQYVTTLEPTCTAPGSEVLTCTRCNVVIGEAREVAALGHRWKKTGDPYEKLVADETGVAITLWFQKYVCNVCNAEEERELPGYIPPVAATVTFDFNGGYYVIPAVGTEGTEGYVAEQKVTTQTVAGFIGDSITAKDIEKAVKDSDATYSYAFAYWATKDQYGNYTEVKLPIVVDGDAIFYAVYEKKNVNYEVTYLREDFSEFKVTGYHHNGSTVDFVDAPKKDGYKFAGWAKVVYIVDETGTEKQVTEVQDIVKINGENVTLIAVYEPVPVYYMVTYTTNKNGTEDDVIERFNVLGGGFARECGIEPTKAPDMLGHYEFVRWDREADLIYVKSDIVTEPVYRTIEHNYEYVVKAEATCTTDRIETYTCKDCGFAYDYVVEGTAGHLWNDWAEAENGDKYRECTVCGEVETEAATAVTYTITYYNADGSVYMSSTVPENALLGKHILKEGPAKATDATNTYEFIGWASKDDVNSIPLTVTEDLELVPVYEATKRTYKVIFAYDGKSLIEEVEVEAGEKAECTKEVKKAYDAVNHYNFTKWSKADQIAAVYSDIYTTAEFEAEAHSAVKTKTVAATCYENAIETYTCECGYTYDKVVVGSAGHTWVDGVCEECGITTGGSTVTYKLAYITESGNAYRYSYNILEGAKLADIVLNYGPEKASDNEKTYKFDSWVVYKKNAETGKVTEEAITDATVVEGNVVLYPKYIGSARQYKVIFAYNAEDVILEKFFDAGSEATCATTPVKKADSKYHYEFDGWNRAAELAEVFGNIYTTPNFKSVGHTFTKTETPATCETNKKITYTCTCGYNYTVEVADSKTDHTWNDGVNDNAGKIVYTCTVCGKATKTETATYKVEYYVDGKLVATVDGVEYGTKLSTMLDKKVTKAEDKTNTYVFNSWLLNGQAPAADAEIKGDVKLDAKFDATKRDYIVIFAYDSQNVIEVVDVKAGEKAECSETPVKDYDDDYHYTFKEWNKAAELGAVYGNIYTTAIFSATAHEYEQTAVKEADCFNDKVITYTCECGKSYTETIAGTKGHNWTETTDANGNKVKECSGCGETTTEGLTFKVTYYVDNKVVSTNNNVEYGTKLADILSTSKPGKDADDAFIYTFKEWKVDGTTSVGDTLVTKDIALHAYYDKTDRLYTVMFGYDGSNLITGATVKNVKFGEISDSLYKGATPTKAHDDTKHFVFDGWKQGTPDKVNNVYFYYAEFEGVAHSKYVDEDAGREATCTQGASIVTKCTGCAYESIDETGKPKPHTYALIESKPAQNGQDGYNKYSCGTCGDEYKDIIKWQDPEAGNVIITVVVKENAQGTPAIAHAKVDLYSGNTWIATEFTNDQGIAKFSVAKGTYRAIISGIQGSGSTEFTFNAQSNNQTVESPRISIKHCSCACHNTGIWGKIFRFFHKIIQMLTGEFKCCGDPSHLYN